MCNIVLCYISCSLKKSQRPQNQIMEERLVLLRSTFSTTDRIHYGKGAFMFCAIRGGWKVKIAAVSEAFVLKSVISHGSAIMNRGGKS